MLAHCSPFKTHSSPFPSFSYFHTFALIFLRVFKHIIPLKRQQGNMYSAALSSNSQQRKDAHRIKYMTCEHWYEHEGHIEKNFALCLG